jgi:hypothetical protein
MMVMGLFSVFWLSFGLLQLPTLQLAAAYSSTGVDAAEGAASRAYNAALALYLIVWGFALFTFWIFTLKTNVVFALIFLFVTIGAWVLAGAYWKVASGDYGMAGDLQKVSLHSIRVRRLVRANIRTGGRGAAVYSGLARMVYDFRYDECRDGVGGQSASR